MKLGQFQVNQKIIKKEIALDSLNPGVNNLDDFIIKLDENKGVVYIIDKVCDHNGGKLIVKGENAVCPLHNWKLNLNTLKYNDSFEGKKHIPYNFITEDKIEINQKDKLIFNPFKKNNKGDLKIRWLNHATVYLEANGIKFITDPWLFGPAFLTGWWLDEPSTTDSIDLLKSSDFVFISHNHPDHLHPETLNTIPKDSKIILGNFKTKSTEKLLRAHGFTNISALEFNDIHELAPNFQISILKSGDFRDDSGIYFNINDIEILLTVDCNILNSLSLPQNIDLLMTSFAGGASGFPLCFNNYTTEEKLKILSRNKRAARTSVINYLKATKPKYYLPYAGMFKEYAERDMFIRENNVKNAPNVYENICDNLDVKYLEPNKKDLIHFKNGSLSIEQIDVAFMQKENYQFYISKYKEDFIYDASKILLYLKNSNFHQNQILQIIPTEESFEKIDGEIVYADFKNSIFKIIAENDIINSKEGYRVMKLFVRKEVISCVVENKLPWEDLSIGFQIRVERSPNEYESEFWYHFTNNYINSEHFRYSPYCGSCTIINQNPLWNKIL